MSDLIDRQAAISVVGFAMADSPSITREDWNAIFDALEGVPSAQPERKKGKWIVDDEFIDCSVCRREKWSRVPYEDLVKRFRYCPKCGADMRGVTDE